MDEEDKLQCAAQYLRDVGGILREAADTYPAFDRPRRAFMRMAKAAERPVRIGILGAANSGKSSLANLLAGAPVLPSSPLAAAKFPIRLIYAPKPFAAAIYESGERVIFPLLKNVAQTLAFLQGSAGDDAPPAGRHAPGDRPKLLEAGLPSDMLRSAEILYFPAGHPGGAGFGIDVAIWTTPATQAWPESEQAQWAELPRSVRLRGMLAVTFCDLAGYRKDNLKQLQDVLETSAKRHFREICFVADRDPDLAAAAARNKALFARIQYLALQLAAERVAKAMVVAHRVMARAAVKPGHGTRSLSNAPGIHAVAETSKNFGDGDRAADLKQPLPRGRPPKPSMLRYRLGSGTAARLKVRRAVQTSRPPAAGERSRERSHWAMISAAAALACTVCLAVIQLGPMGADNMPVSNPLPSASEASAQGPAVRTETPREAVAAAAAEERKEAQAEAAAVEARRLAQAEAAAEARRLAQAEATAAEARRLAQAEAAAAEARRLAQAEAAAVEARRLAEVEATAAEAEFVAEPRRRKRAEARRHRRAEPQEVDWSGRALAEATLRDFNENGPILVGR